MVRHITLGDQSLRCRRRLGFTLIELLIVMVVLATLLTIVAPRYFDSIDKAKDAALKTNLRMMREAIDKYRADRGFYPLSLDDLVKDRYLRALPVDPVTDKSDTWVIIPPPSVAASGVYDIRSGAGGVGKNGLPYASW